MREAREPRATVPVWEKYSLTLEEAAEYFGIGTTKLRELTQSNDCRFVLWNGSKRLIKRQQLQKFLDEQYQI